MTIPYSGPARSVAQENPLAERVRELESVLKTTLVELQIADELMRADGLDGSVVQRLQALERGWAVLEGKP